MIIICLQRAWSISARFDTEYKDQVIVNFINFYIEYFSILDSKTSERLQIYVLLSTVVCTEFEINVLSILQYVDTRSVKWTLQINGVEWRSHWMERKQHVLLQRRHQKHKQNIIWHRAWKTVWCYGPSEPHGLTQATIIIIPACVQFLSGSSWDVHAK